MTSTLFPNSPEDDWNTLASRHWPSLTNDEKIRRLRATFHHAVIGEMRRSLPYIKIGTALLAFCALDFLGALASGKQATQRTFKAFCTQCLLRVDQRYNCDRLWKTRCHLVHNYSTNGGYFLTWEQGVTVHLQRLSGMPGPTIELEQFITDIELAGEALFVAAASDIGICKLILQQADIAAPLGLGRSTVQFRDTS